MGGARGEHPAGGELGVYSQGMAERMAEFNDHAKPAFIAALDAHKREARGMLGDLYDDADYPTAAALDKMIGASLHYLPLPAEAADFRIKIDAEELRRVRADAEADLKTVMGDSVRAMWRELQECVGGLVDKLQRYEVAADGKVIKTFRDSAIEGIGKIVERVERFNFVEDDAVRDMCRQVRRKLAKLDPMELRDNLEDRVEVIEQANVMLAQMAAMMGSGG